jgi:HlyD family secretion protein/adhesin transport system membrane fusion protein
MTVVAAPPPPATEVARSRPRQRYLEQSIRLEEAGPPGLSGLSILVITALVLAAIAWSAVTRVDEVAVAMGEVVPAGSIHAVQHLEGGIVRDILVREGDIVEAGAPLFRMAPSGSQSDLSQMQARRAFLLLQAERLRAFAEGRPPAFQTVIEGYGDLKIDQQAIFATQIASREDQASVQRSVIEQRQAELQLLSNQTESLRGQADLLQEEFDIRARLLQQGLTSRIIYLNTQRELERAKGALMENEDSIARTRTAIEEARQRLAELDSRLRTDALNQVGDVTAELAEVEEAMKALSDRVERLEIRAPVRGYVKGLKILTVNAVIQPGEVLMELVPIGDELVAEARISTRDIGHVELGQAAEVRISSFDYTRFGSAEGVVRQISASTFLDERKLPYYRAVIALARDYLGDDPEANRIIPGMTVEAHIKTGSKSILEYLLKPVYRGFQTAFTER